MMRDMRTLVSFLVLGAIAAPLAAQQRVTADATAAATVGDRTFTTAEVDARWNADAPAQHAQVAQAMYDARRAALDVLIDEYLLDRAARARSLTREAFELEETTRRMRPVTEQEIAEAYAQIGKQLGSRTLQDATPFLREFLESGRRAEARGDLLVTLRKSEPALRINLDPPRRTVDVGPEDPAEGPASAPVTIVEFADFQCPFCGQLAPTLRRIREQYGDQVRVVWKDFPLAQLHPRALQAAEAARCASDQGRFWEYHDRLFTNQRALEMSALKQYAKDVGAEPARFAACLDSGKYSEAVRLAASAAGGLGLTSTPTTFVNGRMVSGAKPYAAFAAVIDEELAR